MKHGSINMSSLPDLKRLVEQIKVSPRWGLERAGYPRAINLPPRWGCGLDIVMFSGNQATGSGQQRGPGKRPHTKILSGTFSDTTHVHYDRYLVKSQRDDTRDIPHKKITDLKYH